MLKEKNEALNKRIIDQKKRIVDLTEEAADAKPWRSEAEGVIAQFLEALKSGRMQAMKDAAAAAVELGLQPGSSIDGAAFHGNVAALTPGPSSPGPDRPNTGSQRYGGL